MLNNPCEISIIIINYNSSEYTLKCVEKVLEKTVIKVAFEIIIVDNASEKADFEALNTSLLLLNSKKVKLIRSRINTGFGGGNMHGVQHAIGSYYLFLNNDTLLLNDCISICYKFLKHTSDAAVCGPQIFNEKHEKQVSFDHFTSFWREVFGKQFVEKLFSKPNRRKEYLKPIPVDYVNGSFMLFKAEDFNNVGGFDSNLFLYYEESDICYRLKQKNRKTYFVPNASYLHYQGKSIGKAVMPLATKIELKTSLFYVIRKNYGYFHYQMLRLVFIIRYGFTSLIKPKYFKLFTRILIGLPLGKSIKHNQTIQ